MFDFLINLKNSENKFLEVTLVSFFYTSLSILISLWIFPKYSSLAMVFISVLPMIYILQRALKIEEIKEKDYASEEWLLKEHLNKLLLFFFLFLGFVFAFSLWAFLLSPEKSTNVFEIQKEAVMSVNAFTGNSVLSGDFIKILSNNIKVMSLALIFAIFYGAGAIFILAWNASVMGFVIGNLARETFGLLALPLAFLKYLIHGIPEMFAYLTAAMAGGILFIAFLKGDLLKKGKTKRIIIDVSAMILLSLVLLVISALIEIYISPLI